MPPSLATTKMKDLSKGMKDMANMILLKNRVGSVSLGLIFGLSVSACDSLLEVDLPHLLTDAAIEDQGTAEVQVNSAIALFECGYTALGLTAMGHEGLMESEAGVFGGGHIYDASADTGSCDSSTQSRAWFDQVMGARALLSTDPARLVPGAMGAGRGVYDRMQDEWSNVAGGERLSAIASIYMAATLTHLGEFLCEIALDGSDLLTPNDVLGVAESWVTTAIGHISSTGAFAMPFGIASDATLMATSIRARARWLKGDLAGANADASTVLAADPAFNAWVTRENGATRRNKIYLTATAIAFSRQLGINNTWNGPIRQPNPATGLKWPTTIPFTGYLFLGVMPDGRALEVGNTPVVWADEGVSGQSARDASGNPVSLGNGAVEDKRTLHFETTVQGSGLVEVPARYTAEDEDVPYMTWEELRFIQADYDRSVGNLQGAVDKVNTLRTAHDVPLISGAYLATLLASTTETRYMLLEERRREFYAEGGRFWSTKIQNTDLLWFPRGEGQTSNNFYNWAGGVRMHMPNSEYDQNPKFIARGGRDARGTGCGAAQAPFIN